MRLLKIVIILSLFRTHVYGQIEVELYFKNTCNDSIVRLNYSVYDKVTQGEYIKSVDYKVNVPKKSTFHLFTDVVNNRMFGIFDPDFEVSDAIKQIDTLEIPRIKFTTDGRPHTKFWSYFNCDKVCNGKEIDFYQNGNKRLEGEFIDGKPKWMTEYRIDGSKEYEYWYNSGEFHPDRLNKYDNQGQLVKYEIKKFKKRKTITLTYDSTDKIVKREVWKNR